jgi:hypothetical protein
MLTFFVLFPFDGHGTESSSPGKNSHAEITLDPPFFPQKKSVLIHSSLSIKTLFFGIDNDSVKDSVKTL